ncbi:MAG: sialidase family protein [Chloroflexota bacterium]
MRRLTLPFIAAVVLSALALLPSAASARVLLPVTDVSQSFTTPDSIYPIFVGNGPNLRVSWRDEHGNFFSRFSTDGGESLGPPQDANDYWTHYYTPSGEGRAATAQAGDDLYQAWSIFNGGGQFFRYSNDLGLTWSDPVTLTDQSFFSIPEVSSFGHDVFVVWEVGGEVFGASSHADGADLSAGVDLGENYDYQITALANGGVAIAFSGLDNKIVVKTFPTGDFSETPVTSTIAPVGGNGQNASISFTLAPTGSAILSWSWAADTKPATHETIRFSYSNNDGQTWASPTVLTDTNSNFEQPYVAAGASGWYFVWGNHTADTKRSLIAHSFYDSGATDAGQVILETDTFFGIPSVAAIGDSGYITWTPNVQLPPNGIKLATLARGAPDPHYTMYSVPLGAGGAPQTIVSTSGADTSLNIGEFGATVGNEESHLLVTRAVITGSSNCTGAITTTDVIAALQAAANLPPTTPCASATDTNCDGAVTPIDALAIEDYLAGFAPAQPATCSTIGS